MTPADAFLVAASAPRDAGHRTGTLQQADAILHVHPVLRTANLYTAAVLGDPAAIRRHVALVNARGGPYRWDALTYLCFSRYLRLQPERSAAFVEGARILLEAGANPNTGWLEQPPYCGPQPVFESVLYAAAAVAESAALTRLLLDFGADPNDDETPYHVPESYDHAILALLLERDSLTARSKLTMLSRKADIHDLAGMKLVLEHGGDPRATSPWGYNALHQALRRDNSRPMIELLLDSGADPLIVNPKDGRNAIQIAAQRGRGDVLRLLDSRGLLPALAGVDATIAACARGERPMHPSLPNPGALLAEFSGNGNLVGIQCLLSAGADVNEPYLAGDPYFDIPGGSSALHVAAWRGRPEVVKELIAHGAAVNSPDAKGRTPLSLAVRACVDSYWMNRRSPDSVAALLAAGASTAVITAPCGYKPVDDLLNV